MNLRRLEYFVTTAKIGHITRASEILNISTPAISKSMKVLEEELGINLWIRDGRRLILSEPGKKLLKAAPSFISQIKDLKDFISESKDPNQPIRIGTFDVFSTYFLNSLVQIRDGNISLEIHECLPGEIEKFLERGDLDFGITYFPVPNDNLDFLKITSIEMGVFTRKDSFKNIPQMELPFVVPVTPIQTVPTKVRGLDGWPEDAYKRKIVHQVTLLESALELCRLGKVAGYFPTFIVKEHNNRVKSEFQLERRKSPYPGRICKTEVFLVKRKSEEESRIAKQIAKYLRQIAKS